MANDNGLLAHRRKSSHRRSVRVWRGTLGTILSNAFGWMTTALIRTADSYPTTFAVRRLGLEFVPYRQPAARDGQIRTIHGGALRRLVDRVISWNRRARDRRQLASYNDRALRDIGIDRPTVEDDNTTSFWRLR